MTGRPVGKVALAIAATALGLLSAEAALWALAALDPRRDPDAARCDRLAERPKCRAAVAAGRPFDSRSRLEVLRDLAREGRAGWPGVKPAGVIAWGWHIVVAGREVVPLGGLSKALTVYCNESGEWVLYTSDEYGFRNPTGLHERPLTVAILGDSFAQGYCVPSEATVAARIRTRYPRTLNLGVDGNGPLIELATLREFAAPLAPRRVVWLYHEGSDPDDLAWERDQPLLRAYLRAGHRHGLRSLQPEIDRQLVAQIERDRRLGDARRAARSRRDAARGAAPQRRAAAELLSLVRLRQRWARLWAAAAGPRRRDDLGRGLEPGARSPADAALLREILTAARDEVAGWGGDLTLVYLPSWEGLRIDPAANVRHAQAEALAADLGLGWVDGLALLRGHPDPPSLFPLRLPGHYTAEGYERLATAILSALDAER